MVTVQGIGAQQPLLSHVRSILQSESIMQGRSHVLWAETLGSKESKRFGISVPKKLCAETGVAATKNNTNSATKSPLFELTIDASFSTLFD